MSTFRVRSVGVAPEAALIGKKLIKRLPTLERQRGLKHYFVISAGSCGVAVGKQRLCHCAAPTVGMKIWKASFEEEGWKEFMDKGFFTGDELYLDQTRETYVALGMRKRNMAAILCSLCNPKAMAKLMSSEGGPGNSTGDSTQNGGCIVVTSGGRDVPLIFREECPAIHVSNEDVLKALKINDPVTKQP